MGLGLLPVVPGEIHLRLRLLPFFLQKAALIAQQSRCTVLQLLVVVKVEFTSIFISNSEEGGSISHSQALKLVAPCGYGTNNILFWGKNMRVNFQIRSSEGIQLEVRIPAVLLLGVNTNFPTCEG